MSLSTKNKMTKSDAISLTIRSFIGGVDYRYGLLILQNNAKVDLTPLQLWLKAHDQVMLFAWYIGYCRYGCDVFIPSKVSFA